MEKNTTTYLFTYQYEGKQYGFEIDALSPQEAKDRLLCIPYARLEGELVMRVPYGYGFLVKPFVRFMNWWKGR